MTKSTPDLPILDDDGVTKVEARRARCLDNKNQSRLAEASILIASDIPDLCQTVRALRAENERAIDVLVTAHNDTVAALQSQLEQVTKERDGMREKVKLMRADYRKRAEEADREHDNVAQLILLHKATAASEIITALESVSIQEQEAHKHDWYNDGPVLRCYDCTETQETKQ